MCCYAPLLWSQRPPCMIVFIPPLQDCALELLPRSMRCYTRPLTSAHSMRHGSMYSRWLPCICTCCWGHGLLQWNEPSVYTQCCHCTRPALLCDMLGKPAELAEVEGHQGCRLLLMNRTNIRKICQNPQTLTGRLASGSDQPSIARRTRVVVTLRKPLHAP
jgi:hypothetical protein